MRLLKLTPLALMAGCANGCAVGKALYIAVVHRSGAPSPAEVDRIAARQDTMMRNLSRAHVVVLPVTILGRGQRVDSSAGSRLAESLSVHGVRATPASSAVPLPYELQPNEALIFWTRFRALGDSIRAHPVGDADYVLAVDVIGAPERGTVAAVHAVTVTAHGELAYRGAWNSAQPLFKEIKPHSIDDAIRMVVWDMTSRAAK